jgi:tRNA pseudouridine38-40 synthase
VKRKNDQDSRNGSKKAKKSSRQWGGQTRRERNVDSRPEAEGAEKEERKPKKKVACFIGYSGEGYHGMQ